MNAVEQSDIDQNVKQNPLYGKYKKTEDRESAYEELQEMREAAEEQAEKERKKAEKEAAKKKKTSPSGRTTSTRKKQSAFDKAVSSAANTVGRELGKSLVRGLLGTLKW